MKKLIASLTVLILLFLMASVTFAAEPPASLTLQYCYDDSAAPALEIKSYYVADLLLDGRYSLVDDFRDYPVDLNGISSQGEWNEIASTLAAYIVAGNVKPTLSATTDSDGKIFFDDLKKGLYLTLSVNCSVGSKTVTFDDFFTVLPFKTDYDVIAYPKYVANESSDDEMEMKLVKQWKDSGNIQNRPESIEVDVYKNDVLEFTRTLSSDNNWSYIWKTTADGSTWRVVERNVPEQYKVLNVQKENTFIITNTSEQTKTDLPETGDTNALWPYQILLCVSGCLILILCAWRKRFE